MTSVQTRLKQFYIHFDKKVKRGSASRITRSEAMLLDYFAGWADRENKKEEKANERLNGSKQIK